MKERLDSLQAIKNALNNIRVTGRDDCYAIVAINNEIDKLIQMEKEVGENG